MQIKKKLKISNLTETCSDNNVATIGLVKELIPHIYNNLYREIFELTSRNSIFLENSKCCTTNVDHSPLIFAFF